MSDSKKEKHSFSFFVFIQLCFIGFKADVLLKLLYITVCVVRHILEIVLHDILRIEDIGILHRREVRIRHLLELAVITQYEYQ